METMYSRVRNKKRGMYIHFLKKFEEKRNDQNDQWDASIPDYRIVQRKLLYFVNRLN